MSSAASQSEAKAIIHPWIDGLAIGGLSIGFILYILIADPSWNAIDVGEKFVVLSALLNWPHFMATYKMLYGSKETVERYPWSTIWMPALLALYCLVAAFVAPYSETPLNLAAFVAGAYLAWHYTGQTWGMMATFSYLGGAPIQDAEKKLIRGSLRILLVWHVVWFVFHTTVFGLRDLVYHDYFMVYRVASYVLISSAAILGVAGFTKYIRRIEGVPPLRVLIPWTSIWLWYALLAVFPFAIFWVQLSHSLQYLIFPARVEANRQRQKKESNSGRKVTNIPWVKGLVYAGVLLGSGVVLFEGLPVVLEWTVPLVSAEVTLDNTKLAVAAFINIHHYFADGAIWKLSNPSVRKELFAHLG